MTSGQNISRGIPVTESSQVGEARRLVASITSKLGMTEADQGRAAIIVTELANNLVKHASGGEIIVRDVLEDGSTGIEILSVDKGRGLDIQQCFRDGFSTAGSSGTGLGSVRRLASTFDVFSQNNGTILLARVFPKNYQSPAFELGGICLPMKGEEYCGDGWSYSLSRNLVRICVVDGLGHGLAASRAASVALSTFAENPLISTEERMQCMHSALRTTRGAAVALIDIDLERQIISFMGVGNIAGQVIDGETRRHFVSQPGTVGLEIFRTQEFQYPWTRQSVILLHSDGITSRFRTDEYRGLISRHPSVISGVLYRDFQRGRDDVTVIAGRQR